MLACVLLAAGEPSSAQLGRDSAGTMEIRLISKIKPNKLTN